MKIGDHALFTLLALLATAFYALGCGTDESETTPAAPGLDVDGGLGPTPDGDNADTAPGTDAAQDEGSKPATLCETIGKVDGDVEYTKVYFKGPYVKDRFIALAGYLIDANYAQQNAGFGVWCWAAEGKDEVRCSPMTKDGTDAVAHVGSGVVIAPGNSPTASETDTSKWTWYCEKDSCPVGTLVVCAGKREVCRLENGVKSGTADYEKNPDGWSNIKCTIPAK